MAANVAAGVVQNILWTSFSLYRYRKSGHLWTTWPGLVVAWVTFAMSLELFDFPPWFGSIDAHSLWHMMTIAPTVLWYKSVSQPSPFLLLRPQTFLLRQRTPSFLVKDAQDDIAAAPRPKA